MSFKRNILDLRKRKKEAQLGGGEKAIEKQVAMGKKTARERIKAILDENSFHEYDLFVEHTGRDFDMEKKVLHGDGVIIGTGTMYNQPVAIYAQDFTVAGGSLGLMHARKITKIMDHALKMRVPLIGTWSPPDDDLRLGPHRLDRAQQVHAVHAGHPQVGQDHAEVVGTERLQRVLAGRLDAHVESLPVEDLPQRVQRGLVVVDHQDSRP